MDIEPTEAILLIVFLGLAIPATIIPIWNEFVIGLKTMFLSIIPNMGNLWIYLLILIVISPFFYRWLFKKLQEKKERRDELEEEEAEIEEILDENIKEYEITELKEFIESLDELSLTNPEGYGTRIERKLTESKEYLKDLEREEYLSEREFKVEEAEDKLKLIDEEIKRKKREMEQEKFKIILSLNPEENPVYKKDSLSNKEIKILIEEGYSHHNEFCVYEQKIIPVLIKSVLGHSPSHTFLVWSAKRLLKKIDGVKYIEESLTRDADITFMYDREEYALEIETGSLLGKHEQLREKLNYLNRKYPDKWLFIVSHRDLLPKYKKLGLTATRNNVLEKLEKLLKIAHP